LIGFQDQGTLVVRPQQLVDLEGAAGSWGYAIRPVYLSRLLGLEVKGEVGGLTPGVEDTDILIEARKQLVLLPGMQKDLCDLFWLGDHTVMVGIPL
jgi:hypothetical protein